MRCGAKCFIVEYEVDGHIQTASVNSRTPAEARKQWRMQTAGNGKVLTVRRQQRASKEMNR